MNNKVIVRFPPSPTGKLHIGNIRSFLFNYLYARKHNGEIVMRFEDTDLERSKKEYEEFALETLKELGLDFERGPFRQSERTEFYVDAIETLIKNQMAYEAEEREAGNGEKVIRFRNPNKIVSFEDKIRGKISIDTSSFGDFIIARSKKLPLYHLTVVVDDINMGITDVIRGEDHITSTPRQILLIEALGGIIPRYTHLPLIIGEDKKKLGKRHGAVTWQEFKEKGYLPEGIVNYLALLGWNPGGGDEREFFSKNELIKEFSLEKINNSPAIFSYTKLNNINKHWMIKLDEEKYFEKVLIFLSKDLKEEFKKNLKKSRKIVNFVIKERASKFSDISDMEKNKEFDYFFSEPKNDKKKLIFRDDSLEKTLNSLEKVYKILSDIDELNWNKENLREKIFNLFIEGESVGSILHPLRMSLTGVKKSPNPFVLMDILGKEESLKRIKNI